MSAGFAPVDWERFAVVLEWLSFFLVTPEFLGEARLKQLAVFLQRFGRDPFRAADLLLSRGGSIRIEIEGMSRMDALRQTWRLGDTDLVQIDPRHPR